MKRIIFFAISMIFSVHLYADITLERCIEAAYDNYPLIKKYGLYTEIEDLEISDINRAWLPRINTYAQATAQNVVPSFPSTLSNVMAQMGGDIEGLSKFQYKVGIDVNQTIWDGGLSKSNREIVRSKKAAEKAALDVDLYSIRSKIESYYFGALLIKSQIAHSVSAADVYEANLSRLKSMLKNGVAMQSDVDMVEAQLLSIRQQIIEAQHSEAMYRTILAIFTGIDLKDENLLLPSEEIPLQSVCNRPELKLFDARINANQAQRNMIKSSVNPKIGFFAQSYYGYPGIDYFKAMMDRNPTFNIVAGVKLSWNIDALYTKKNSISRLAIADEEINADKETFLLNNRIQQSAELTEINTYTSMIASDNKIIDLRKNVRTSAESQLANGIIDATSLIMKINDETQARITASYHQIQRIKAIYNYKTTLNL